MNRSILVFSHLRWDFVYQRPQHLLSRLAARHGRRVLFVEEPLYRDIGVAFWEKSEPAPGVTVCRPHTPVPTPGFTSAQLPLLRRLIQELIAEEELSGYDAWLYTPMAVPLLEGLRPRVVVYDVMDELSAFKFAPPELPLLEQDAYRAAGVVFTGGPSLYQAKKTLHRNVHCFPSSVDQAHFGRARNGMDDPADQRDIPHPRLGFFGVIDERMDLALLAELADQRPEWHLVMVGPVVKIQESDLPRRANLHYLGPKQYSELPAYMANWDVCLLPFALNESTRFISPTKTLEYMAAAKPIVSTPIRDVAEPYAGIVALAPDAAGFAVACAQALEESGDQRAFRIAAMDQVLSRTSWDRTVDAMHDLIEQAATVKARPGRAASYETVVVGAGPTGLSAAYHLGAGSLLIEREPSVGGWCRSLVDRGFTFDFAGHIMFSNEPYVHQMYQLLLGDNVHWQDREAWIFSKGAYTRYPFQGSLYGLPPEVIQECLVGAIEARFGPLQTASPKANGKANGKTNGKANGHTVCKPGDVKDCCADGILEAEAPLAVPELRSLASQEPRNFEEFIYRVWGAGIAKHFAIPYNRKLWGVPLSDMETSWLGGRVPLPDVAEMIEGALRPKPKPMGPNARFGYPLRGGFQALMNGFLPHLKGELRLGSAVVAVSPGRRSLTLSDGSQVRYRNLVSTMPLPVLVRMAGAEAPPRVRAAAAALRHVSVRCVNLGIGREKLTEKHWIYYPEDTVFHRIFVQGNASPHCNPPGGFGLTCEITYSGSKPLPCDGDELTHRCIQDCIRVGLIRPDDPVLAANHVDMPYAYVVYDHARAANVQQIREWLEGHGIVPAGRYAEWEYYNSDHAFVAGRDAAERVQTLQSRGIRSASGAGGDQPPISGRMGS